MARRTRTRRGGVRRTRRGGLLGKLRAAVASTAGLTARLKGRMTCDKALNIVTAVDNGAVKDDRYNKARALLNEYKPNKPGVFGVPRAVDDFKG